MCALRQDSWQGMICTFHLLSKSQGGRTSGQFQAAELKTNHYFWMQCAHLAVNGLPLLKQTK